MIPAPAYRRTWLAERLALSGLTFVALYRQLEPARFKRLRERTPEVCYRGLLAHCGRRFPTFEPWGLDDLGGGPADLETWADLEHAGIPAACYGVSAYEDLPEITSPAVALVLALALSTADETPETPDDLIGWSDALGPYRARLAGRLAGFDFKHRNPPRGRRWRAPWDALPDLLNYCCQNTGFGFLDISNVDYVQLPPWRAEEIGALAAAWREAEPLWRRIEALREHVDARPAERLPQLAGALCGAEAVRRELSRPAREKTLIEVFAREPQQRA